MAAKKKITPPPTKPIEWPRSKHAEYFTRDYTGRGYLVPLSENPKTVMLKAPLKHHRHPNIDDWVELAWDDTHNAWRIRGSDSMHVILDSSNTVYLKMREPT
jgi:hypothetical protein